jgi:hypothetical protein
MRAWIRSLLIVCLGLVAGIALGLYLGWVAWPTEFSEADPVMLRESYRRDYALMIAATYDIDNDLDAAQRRLANLDAQDGRGWLFTVTIDAILAENNPADIRQLVRLATDLGLYSPAFQPYLAPTPTE